MLISYVIRLRPDALDHGQFVGEIEAVSTCVRSSFRSVQQATGFILATATEGMRRAGELADRDEAGLRAPETDGVRLRTTDGGEGMQAPYFFGGQP